MFLRNVAHVAFGFVLLVAQAAIAARVPLHPLTPNLLLPIVIFLGVQAYEYYKLAGHGFVPSIEGYAAEGGPLYGSTFYTMTGFHGAHVFLGVVALCFTLFRAMRGAYDSGSYGGVEVMGLYWHFVDLVWIILFTIVYLM